MIRAFGIGDDTPFMRLVVNCPICLFEIADRRYDMLVANAKRIAKADGESDRAALNQHLAENHAGEALPALGPIEGLTP